MAGMAGMMGEQKLRVGDWAEIYGGRSRHCHPSRVRTRVPGKSCEPVVGSFVGVPHSQGRV